MEVLIHTSFQTTTKTPFAGMVTSPKQALRASLLFERVLRQSFEYDEKVMGQHFRAKVQTGAEMKRRAEIMARWFRVFRGELGYSMARVEAELGSALRSELDGGLYTPGPKERSFGVPQGDRQ